MSEIIETIQVKPLSVNQVWRGRRFKTKEYEGYEKECMFSMPQHEMIEGPVMVQLRFYLKFPKRCDLDNFIKPILDIIVKKGWIQDDRFVQMLLVTKATTKYPDRIVVKISKVEES